MTAHQGAKPDVTASILLLTLGIAAVGALGAAASVLVTLLPMYQIELRDHCVDFLQWMGGHPEIALAALPLGLLAVSTTRAMRRGHYQMRHTRQLMRVIGPGVPLPVHVAALAGRLGIEDRVDVVGNPVPTVFCHGLLRPRICLTTGLLDLLDAEELEAVLLHERHHVHRRDPARLVAARTVLACVGFLPGAQVIHEHYLTASELAADGEASGLPNGRLALASSILKLARTHRSLLTDQAAVSALSTVQGRVEALLSEIPQPPRLPIGALIRLAGGLVLLVALLTAPVALAERPEPAALHPCLTSIEQLPPAVQP